MFQRFQRIFDGRNGIDPMSIFLLCLALPFFSFRRIGFGWVIGLLIIAYVLFRCFSRNVEKRRQELYAFYGVLRKISLFFSRIVNAMRPFFNRISKFFATRNMQWKQRKEYVFVRCPRCKKTLRLPRNKGKIVVSCPMCRN